MAVATRPHRIAISEDRRFLTIGQLCERYSRSSMWIERKLRDTQLNPPFPRPTKFGGAKSVRHWRLSEIEAWEIARAKINEQH